MCLKICSFFCYKANIIVTVSKTTFQKRERKNLFLPSNIDLCQLNQKIQQRLQQLQLALKLVNNYVR